MQIFTQEFQIFIKSLILCLWRGHKPGKWQVWYWAPAHFAGYRKFCKRCGTRVSRAKEEQEYFRKGVGLSKLRGSVDPKRKPENWNEIRKKVKKEVANSYATLEVEG